MTRGDPRLDDVAPVRLAELVAALSLATDLGLGQPMEHVLRSTVLALRIAEDLGLDDGKRATVYYVGLLAWVGCHADSFELAAFLSDDIEARAHAYEYDLAGLGLLRYFARHIGGDRPPLRRAQAFGAFATTGWKAVAQVDAGSCVIAADFARRLGLSGEVQEALRHCYERWDGKGQPGGLAGDRLAIPARIVQVADTAVAWHGLAGVPGAVDVARRRSGTQFDPDIVERFCRLAPALFAELDGASNWEALIESEPSLRPAVSDEGLDAVLEALADFGDLKSPHFAGHSRGVASLVRQAAPGFGLPPADATRLRRAALVQDIGRLGVSNAAWDKRGPLSSVDWERVRLHPYLAHRVLARPAVLADLGSLALVHHERLDGSGYPRGLSGAALSPAARLLAAADSYQAMLEPRPHRPALGPERAEDELRAEVRAGRLDGDAVAAVLAVTGRRIRRRREWPANLTPREVEVLRLLARGASTKEIAQRLVISPKTAGKHIEHIYLKTGSAGRAAASLFAVRHGLLGVEAER